MYRKCNVHDIEEYHKCDKLLHVFGLTWRNAIIITIITDGARKACFSLRLLRRTGCPDFHMVL